MSHEELTRADHADELIRSALTSHEHLAPDAAAVYAGAAGRATAFRRGRTVRAAGCVVAGAGLVVGALAVPGLLPGGGGQAVVVQSPAAAPGSGVATGPYPAPSAAQLQAAYDAYFAAGYGYTDAQRLAKVWQVADDPGGVKAQAGHALLDGRTLPIEPGPESEPEAGPATDETRSVDAFFAAGYDYDDAVRLAGLWNTATAYDAKVEAGARLNTGQELPFRP